LANFSKEFYHWLAVSDNEAQRFCITKVATAARVRLDYLRSRVEASACVSEHRQSR